MFGKWTAREKLFHVVLRRTVSHEHYELYIVSSFPKAVVSPNSELRFPLRFAAVIVYFRISTGRSWMSHLMVLFEEKS